MGVLDGIFCYPLLLLVFFCVHSNYRLKQQKSKPLQTCPVISELGDLLILFVLGFVFHLIFKLKFSKQFFRFLLSLAKQGSSSSKIRRRNNATQLHFVHRGNRGYNSESAWHTRTILPPLFWLCQPPNHRFHQYCQLTQKYRWRQNTYLLTYAKIILIAIFLENLRHVC